MPRSGLWREAALSPQPRDQRVDRASGGRWGTRLAQAALGQRLFATESHVASGAALYLADAQSAIDAGGWLAAGAHRDALRQVRETLNAVSVGRG